MAYPETDTRQLSSILVVVRADATDPPKTLSDLKGKRSCFPEYGGKGKKILKAEQTRHFSNYRMVVLHPHVKRPESPGEQLRLRKDFQRLCG